MKDKKININTTREYLQEMINILERVIVILEDNPKIKEDMGLFNAKDVILEVYSLHQEITEVLK